jgi:hypothetical protein
MPKSKSSPHLESMQKKLVGLRDDVISVALGYHSGLFAWGPPGTSKTWTIKSQLRDMSVAWSEPTGTMTPRALFQHLQRHPTEVTLIEDQEGILRNPQCLSILRAALWTTDRDPTGRGRIPEREVQWNTARGQERVPFGGGIIITQNSPPPQTEEVAAVLSRVITRHLTASTDELVALMRHISASSPPTILRYRMTVEECGKVAEFVIAQSLERGRRPNLKLLDIAYSFFAQYEQGDSAQHWEDRVVAQILERAPRDCVHEVDLTGATRRERQERDRDIVRQIMDETPDPNEQVRLWEERTGRGKSMFYERRKEVQKLGS